MLHLVRAFLTRQTPLASRPATVFAGCKDSRSLLGLTLLWALAGCNGFFVKPTTTTSTSTTTSTTGDYAYVANSSAGSTSLSEYNVANGTLASVGTLNLGYVPVALAVAPNNGFLYVASSPGAATPGLYVYSISSSTGALTAANSGNVLAVDTVAAMAISPDGNWLYTVNSTGITMNEYQVNTTSGALSLASTITLPGTGCLLTSATPATQSCSVAVSPNGTYVVAALGTAGDAVFTYASASGITGSGFTTIASGFSATNPTGDYSVALDGNNNAYLARTSTLGVYSLGSTVPNTGNLTFAAGTVPRGLALNKAASYLFVANEGTGTVSSYAVGSTGSLKAVTGSPFAAATDIAALGADNTGSYLVGVGYDASTGVRLYSVSSAGVLTQVAAAGSGTNTGYPALVAMTH